MALEQHSENKLGDATVVIAVAIGHMLREHCSERFVRADSTNQIPSALSTSVPQSIQSRREGGTENRCCGKSHSIAEAETNCLFV